MNEGIGFDGGRGRIWTTGRHELHSVAADAPSMLGPVELTLFEWTDYWVHRDGATGGRVGGQPLERVADGLFRLRFENQLGLARIILTDDRGPVCPPLVVEVLSPKFSTLAEHVVFFGALLDDLFARAANLPFSFSAETARGVVESPAAPTLLFAYHFIVQHAAELWAAVDVIRASPHRLLADDPAVVPLAEASEVNIDVLLDAVRNADRWVPARGLALAARLGGMAPTAVWQRRPFETVDTPENRFALAFVRTLLAAIEGMPAAPWWSKVSTERQRIVVETGAILRHAIAATPFAEVGPMRRFPAASRVLMRREGYRQLLVLWLLFQRARRPLFATLQQAIDLRDVATLYESWAFFALIDEIALALDKRPGVELAVSDDVGLRWQATARFGGDRRLVYNREAPSYSVRLRPDFTWWEGNIPAVAFDAKFRLERHDFDAANVAGPATTPKRDDLYKMHTYRDALGVRAAVAIYPGDASVFYDATGGKQHTVALTELLIGNRSGIGAVSMRPVGILES